jgi:hypothetical protein
MSDHEQSGIRMNVGGNARRPLHARLADHAEAAMQVEQQPLVQAVLAVYFLLDERLPRARSVESLDVTVSR